MHFFMCTCIENWKLERPRVNMKRKRRNIKKKNKAGYMAIPVADGWAAAEIRVFTLFNSCTPTDRRTDKGSYRVAFPQLKRKENENHD